MLSSLLALALFGAPPTASPPPPLEVLDAGQVDYDVVNERGVATGGVVLRRGLVTLHADSARYDLRTGEVDAEGGVLLTEPGRAVSASRMHAVLDGPYQAHDVVAFLKQGALDLSRCRTLEEARATGRNRATLGGAELQGESGAPGFQVERARITLCDCGGGKPSWSIRAHHADIVPGKRAILTWPVFYITPRLPFVSGTVPVPVLRRIIGQEVPVMALPALYLPLSDRQTGLLFPELTLGGNAGTGVVLPLFITLGRSWDATVAAQWYAGSAGTATRGWGPSLELRWAPAEGARGQVRLELLHSLTHDWPSGVALPPGWNRVALSGLHDQRLSDATHLRLELGLIDDPLYLQHFTGDALLRGAEYRRSALALTHRQDDVLWEADAAYHLALLHLDEGAAGRAPFGGFGADLGTFHRLPSASATLLPVRLGGPLRLSGTLGVARFAPLSGVTGDEGADGIGPGVKGWGAEGAAPDVGERDGRWDGPTPGKPGERLAATRTVARAELRAPISLGEVAELEPWAALTGAAYAFEAGPQPRLDARATAGLDLSTELSRTYGSGTGRVRHAIEPRLAWRGGTGQLGAGVPNYAYDELDVALPEVVRAANGDVVAQRTLSATPGSFSQLQLSVRNRLVAPAGPLSNGFLEVTLGQDLDLASGKASETWARGALRLALVSVDAYARFRAFGARAAPGTPGASSTSGLDAFTELGGNVTLLDGRGDNVHAGFIALGAGGSPRVMAGLEPFFDPRPVAESAVALGSVGVAGHLGAAILSYDALFNERDLPSACPDKVRSPGPRIYQHQGSLVWDSPCHCWKLGVSAILNECDKDPRFQIVLDLSSIGGPAIAH